MKAPQRVVWSEGMLVSPQHLQQLDLYHERLLDGRVAAVAPLAWGVLAADVDVGALGAGQLKITRFSGVLPDGLYLDFEAGDAEAPPARPIEGHFPPALPALEVYLAVPKERDGVPSVGPDGVAPAAAGRAVVRHRFRAANRNVADMAGEGAELAMAFAQRNVGVLFGDEARDDYDGVKIAEIVRDGAGALIVNEAYIPPVLRVGASPFIMGGLRRMLAQMVAKQRQLSEERRQRDGASVEFSANDVTRFLQLNTLNTAIPVLTHVGQSGYMNPGDLYLFLIQVAGQLTTFSPDADPSQFPAFLFNDLRATYEELFARITALLRATVREVYVPVPLDVNQGVHVGKLEDERFPRCKEWVLAVRSELPQNELATRIPGVAKIASWTQLPYILRSAVPGIPLAVTHRPPQEIPVRNGVTYFMLDTRNEHWRHIEDERTVAVYLPPPFDPSKVKVELLGIPRA